MVTGGFKNVEIDPGQMGTPGGQKTAFLFGTVYFSIYEKSMKNPSSFPIQI
jgi:hypothetical protein